MLAVVEVPATQAVEVLMVEAPHALANLWVAAIAVAAPLIVGGINKVVPKIPKVVLPASTPFVGVVLGLLLNWILSADMAWVDAAQAGALAVFVREVWNQAVTKHLAHNQEPKAD